MGVSNRLLEERLLAIRTALDALAAGTDANLQRIRQRLVSENKALITTPLLSLDELARAVRTSSFMLVARHQPLARDLKFAMAALRIAHDYERVQELLDAFSQRIDHLANTPVETFLTDMLRVADEILELHTIVQTTWHRPASGPAALPPNSEPPVHPKSRVLGLVAATEAELAAIQNSIVEAVEKGYGSPEMLFELVLACRHLQRITQLMEGIPADATSFD